MPYNNSFHDWLFNNMSAPSPLRLGLGIALGGLIAIVAIWSLIWKGLALWKAARQGSKWWFIILLVVNTIGILDILYIYLFSKKGRIKKMMEPAKPVSSDESTNTDATVV